MRCKFLNHVLNHVHGYPFHQRFFKQLIVSMKADVVVEEAKTALASRGNGGCFDKIRGWHDWAGAG